MNQDFIHIISILIPLMPLLGFFIHTLVKSDIREKLAGIIATIWVALSFICSCILFYALNYSEEIHINLANWINTGNLNISFAFLIDHLSILMMLIITGIGCLIHIFSIGYMHGDDGYNRFFSYLNLFIFFMLVLVMADNYVLMFVGWEGVGLCSYLLIGFWFKNQEYNKAANKAFIMNRIGDLALLIGLFMLFNEYGSLTYNELFVAQESKTIDPSTITIITMLLFIGATGKSAQIPLFTWLPDAMAGPTPVSALIHAATMVTAGIYLIVRSNLLFSMAPETLVVVMVTGLVTSIFAGTIAIKQNDIKKVLAYSTVSQLGLMFFAIGIHAYEAAFFHVITHAFFKALLFLGAGSVIHGLNGEQDIRKMGGLSRHMKITHAVFLTGVLAIIAMPPFSGFFSKDNILESAFMVSPILWGIALISGLITVFYMMRLYFLVFKGEERMEEKVKNHIHESPNTITIPLIILSVLSIFGGLLNVPEMFAGHRWLKHYLEPVVPIEGHHSSSFIEWILFSISTVAVTLLVFVSYQKYISRKSIPEADDKVVGFAKILTHKYYIDELYQSIIVKPLMSISNFLHDFVEINIIDATVNNAGKLANTLAFRLKDIQTGNISYYLFAMALGMGGILFFFILF